MQTFFQSRIKNYTTEQVFEKIKHYCFYQPRCCSEVKEKLSSFNISKEDSETILSDLIKQGILNEEIFAIAFAQGRFRLKQWGKQKIKYALKEKRVSDLIIVNALNAINVSEYKKVFTLLANKKLQTLSSEKNILIRKKKLTSYLLQKGFELQLIQGYLRKS